ncbi:Nup53/35/40-type RNA recognition motif-domain-containing protein [Lipomyces tetrasporus]
MRYKNSPGAANANGYYTPDRYAGSPGAGASSPGGLGQSRPMTPLGAIPGSQSSTALSSSASASRGRGSKFGGPSFGVPKPHHARSLLAQSSSANVSFGEIDELPPTDSIYDTGAASPFAFQLPTTSGAGTTEATALAPSSSSAAAAQNEDKYGQPGLPSTPSTPNVSTSTSPTKDQPTSVVVFGFPPDLTHVVVDHFARFGTIMEHLSSGPSGSTGDHITGASGATPVETGKNWVKITYTTASAANRALAENGRPLGSMDYVIGCVPHTPSGAFSPGPAPASANGIRRSGMRGSGPSLNIHALLSEGASEDLASYANRRRNGDDGLRPPQPSSSLFTPQQPQLSVRQASQETRQAGGLPRTTSMPAGLGKRIDVRGPEGIFKEKERKGISGSATLRGLASIFMGGQDQQQQLLPPQGVKRGAGDDLNGAGKRMQGQEGWLGWTTKKAQEFIFGWDDL